MRTVQEEGPGKPRLPSPSPSSHYIPAEKVMQVAVDNAHIGIPPSFNHRDQGTVF